ncbi:hypothetical protein [Rhodoferax sp. PAMC 29310]|uniref:hypothetical protein n=1 Tax=Rhodoferax sp. PAMC 29310 TaxID=2822760 RepID=UPI001B344D61|nr:hypothetical protein [Rhodoferax sp. PAMC 29310]
MDDSLEAIPAVHRVQRIAHGFGKADFRFCRKLSVAGSAKTRKRVYTEESHFVQLAVGSVALPGIWTVAATG